MSNQPEKDVYESELRRENAAARASASENAVSGVFLGIILAALLGVAAAFLFLGRRSEVPAPVAQPQQAPAQQPPDVNINVPQAPAPQIQPPDINLNVPAPQAPVSQPAPVDQQAPAQDPGAAQAPAPAPAKP
jgi:hypothetical protein